MDILEIIEKMQEMYGDDVITTADKINRPEPKKEVQEIEAINAFMKRNPKAGGGMLVKPSVDGSRPGYAKKDIITNYSPEVQKLIKDYGINKYKKLNPQQKYAVRNQPTSTTPYTFNFGKNKFDITVKGLTKKGANNIQELLNIINKEELTPENWFGKTSRKQGKKGGASAGVDAMARDLVKYLKGETIVGRTSIHQTIFDQLNIKDLIGKNKANILSQIDGKSFRQAIGTKEAAKSAVESSFDAVKYINKEFILDPDITLDELAEQIYGKGASNSVRAMKDTQLDILKYLDVLKTGTRRGIKIPNFDYPSKNKIFEILDSIEDRSSSFGFQDGAVRDLKFNIRDNLLNYKKGSTMDLRRLLSDIISESDFAGSVIDESVGLSATYDTMPGYTEATQILPDELNKYKSSKIDKPFNELLKKIGNGTATPEEIKNYNKVARAFIKETGVDAPIVRSSIIGDKISLKNIKKYIKNFDNFSSAAQENIKDVAKTKNLIIETKASPLTLDKGKATVEKARDFFEQNKKLRAKILKKNVKLPSGSGGVTLGALDAPSMFRRLSPGTKKLVSGAGGFIVPEVLFYQLDKINRMSKGQSEKEAAAGALKSGTLGAYKNKAYMEELKKVAESMNIDSSSFDSAYQLNLLSKNYNQNNANYEKNYMQLLEMGDEQRADDLKKNFDRYTKEAQNKYALLSNNISDNVMNTVGASPLIMKEGRENITQKKFEKPFFDIQDVAMEKLKREKQKAFPKQSKQVDTAAGKIGEGFYRAFDSLTQGAKNLLKGRVIPFASKIGFPQYEPLESDRQREDRYLKEMDPRELFLYNKARGVTYDDPITSADFENLQYEQPGLFAGGGIAGLSGGIDQGPQRRSLNPDSQGLRSLIKNGRKL